jgi:hypothetical protein
MTNLCCDLLAARIKTGARSSTSIKIRQAKLPKRSDGDIISAYWAEDAAVANNCLYCYDLHWSISTIA